MKEETVVDASHLSPRARAKLEKILGEALGRQYRRHAESGSFPLAWRESVVPDAVAALEVALEIARAMLPRPTEDRST